MPTVTRPDGRSSQVKNSWLLRHKREVYAVHVRPLHDDFAGCTMLAYLIPGLGYAEYWPDLQQCRTWIAEHFPGIPCTDVCLPTPKEEHTTCLP